ncbi:marginal zone B- and B1-cell-specific protein-like [Limulus polyphemus]|uniref:Marginal zone B- and B1-cell-specific protein-like n=1 Tax=Limulus polyphemus TaxID=6850 RepID=A0ABM1TAP2_LIMPO|nr:marginal zone B- and B1-cell-specific protein-like [Limulus polyphemus]
MGWRKILIILVINVLVFTFGAEGPKGMKFSVPQLSEEEQESAHLPNYLKCDACLAVAYQLQTALAKNRKSGRLAESDVFDIMEYVCEISFQNYGLKEVEGVKRLSGPGLPTENVAAMTQMGGKWPSRIQEICHMYLGEIGEMEIYRAFQEDPHQLSVFMCYGQGVQGYCNHQKDIKVEEHDHVSKDEF